MQAPWHLGGEDVTSLVAVSITNARPMRWPLADELADELTSAGARRKLLGGQLQPRLKRKRKRKGKQRVEDRGEFEHELVLPPLARLVGQVWGEEGG